MATPSRPQTQGEWSHTPCSSPDSNLTLENAYYDAEDLQERGDLDGAAAKYEQIVTLEQPQTGSEWGFRAHKQLVYIHTNRREYEKSLELYGRLLAYLDAAVPRTLVEQTINELLEDVAARAAIPTTLLERFFTSTLSALAEAGVPANDRLWFRTKVRLGSVYLHTGALWKLSILLRELYRRLGVFAGDDQQNLISSASLPLGQQRKTMSEAGEIESPSELSNGQLLELYALDMQLQLALGEDLAAVPCLLPEALAPPLPRPFSASPSTSVASPETDAPTASTLPWRTTAAEIFSGTATPSSQPAAPEATIIPESDVYTCRLRRLYYQAMSVKWVLPSPRAMATIRTCGGKLFMIQGRFAEAAREFFEAFRHYEQVGAAQRVSVLRYVVLANLLSGNTVNLFAAPELQAYRAESCVQVMADLIDAYQRDDLAHFEDSLKRDEGIMEDAFLRPYVQMLSSRLWQRAVQRVIQPYRSIYLANLAERLGSRGDVKAIEQVEQALVQLIIDGQILGRIDQEQGVLELSQKRMTAESSPASQRRAIPANEQTRAMSIWSNSRMADESLVNPTRYTESSHPVYAVEMQRWQRADPDADPVDTLLTGWAQRLGRVRAQLARLDSC
jgi:tetratricopeptide (TPR) repeat protein